MDNEKKLLELREVTIRFAGDSGDGMQLTGQQFSDNTAWVGNDLNTLPDYPAEIRAPSGTLYGVSGFQLHFSSEDIFTPGDHPDVLIAMNPAALKKNLPDLKPGGTIIVNSDTFDTKNLKLANYQSNPLEDGSLKGYQLFQVPISSSTARALEGLNLSVKEIERTKNFFALGLLYWLFNRPIDTTLNWIKEKFAKKPEYIQANERALKAGYDYGDITEIFTARYSVGPAKLSSGIYRNISGNEATALGFLAASVKSKLPLFLGSYPITPATEILQYLSEYKEFGVKTFQAEDEISAITTAIGAAFAGNLAITSTSGPGLSLKTEALGLAIMAELPLVVIDVQRGGPSTGLPTKTEQGDLLQAVFGRNGQAPLCVLAAKSPSHCFDMAYQASKIAIKYMTPVILLTDGYIANGSEPWKIPNVEELPEIPVNFAKDKAEFYPYKRNEFLARPWAIPGTPNLEHRIGGLEKSHIYGHVSYDPENHHLMVTLRHQKIQNIQQDIPDVEIEGDYDADLLVVGWGSTYGTIKEAVIKIRNQGYKVAQIHLNYIYPFPKNTADVLNRFSKILVPEINLGQLAYMLRSEFLVNVIQYNKIRGLPLTVDGLMDKILEILGVNNGK